MWQIPIVPRCHWYRSFVLVNFLTALKPTIICFGKPFHREQEVPGHRSFVLPNLFKLFWMVTKSFHDFIFSACDRHHHSTMRNFQWVCMMVHTTQCWWFQHNLMFYLDHDHSTMVVAMSILSMTRCDSRNKISPESSIPHCIATSSETGQLWGTAVHGSEGFVSTCVIA